MKIETFDVILLSPSSGFGAKTHGRKGKMRQKNLRSDQLQLP